MEDLLPHTLRDLHPNYLHHSNRFLSRQRSHHQRCCKPHPVRSIRRSRTRWSSQRILPSNGLLQILPRSPRLLRPWQQHRHQLLIRSQSPIARTLLPRHPALHLVLSQRSCNRRSRHRRPRAPLPHRQQFRVITGVLDYLLYLHPPRRR